MLYLRLNTIFPQQKNTKNSILSSICRRLRRKNHMKILTKNGIIIEDFILKPILAVEVVELFWKEVLSEKIKKGIFNIELISWVKPENFFMWLNESFVFENMNFAVFYIRPFVPWHKNTQFKIFQKFVTLMYSASGWKSVELVHLLLLRNSTRISKFQTTLRRISYTKKTFGNLGQNFIKISFLKPTNQMLFMKALRDILSKKVF